MPIFKGVLNVHPLSNPVGQRANGQAAGFPEFSLKYPFVRLWPGFARVPMHFRVRGKLAKTGLRSRKALVFEAFMCGEYFANPPQGWQSSQAIRLSSGRPLDPFARWRGGWSRQQKLLFLVVYGLRPSPPTPRFGGGEGQGAISIWRHPDCTISAHPGCQFYWRQSDPPVFR